MRVNSAFKSFHNNRLVGSGMAIAMLAIFFIASSFTKRSDRDIRAKHANLLIREIGHRLLLQAGDSTSRVLPVTETNEGTFLLGFERDFIFSHDSLMVLTRDLLPKTQFPSGYTVTVYDCMTSGIVYGFQINHAPPDILACRGRDQPQGCYTIEIALPDLYENVAQEEADTGHPVEKLKSVKVDRKEPNDPKPEELKVVIADPREDNPKLQEITSSRGDLQEGNPKPEKFKTATFDTATFDFAFISLVCSGMLLLMGVALVVDRLGKRLVPVPVPVQDQRHAITESVPEVSALGKFLFDVKDQRLLLGSEVISLTDKECRILELLNKSFGELIHRETLMQKVWINEGVITGRSLDMFVSKLRKKLSSDPELRITNVHGKGYKLEIPGVQVL